MKAAEVVNENDWDVKLIYNDFVVDWTSKARVVYDMVKDINERYADVRPNGVVENLRCLRKCLYD